jgi:hypothetical protein
MRHFGPSLAFAVGAQEASLPGPHGPSELALRLERPPMLPTLRAFPRVASARPIYYTIPHDRSLLLRNAYLHRITLQGGRIVPTFKPGDRTTLRENAASIPPSFRGFTARNTGATCREKVRGDLPCG